MPANISSINATQTGVKINLKQLSMVVLFPILIIAPTLLNQHSSELRFLGQIMMMGGTLAVIAILFFTMGRQKWLVLCVAGFLFSKAGRIAFGENSLFYPLYIIFMAFLFSRAGSVILLQEPKLIYRQVMMFCKLSVPLMVLQVLGVGKWTQVLRTDSIAKIQFATLFVSSEDVIVTGLQFRPAGFCYANNVLTPWVILALGLHYGLTKTSKLTFNDVVLCTIAILTMSKLAFLSFGVIMLWLLIAGDGRRRKRIIKVVFLFCGLLVAYSFFFPGLYSYNLDPDYIRKNFMGRAAALARSMEDNTVKEYIVKTFEDDEYFQTRDSGSGYSVIAKYLTVVFPVLLGMLVLWFRGLKRLRAFYPDLAKASVLIMFISFLLPLGNWFAEGPAFWFIAGFGLLPLFSVLEHDFIHWGLNRKIRRSF